MKPQSAELPFSFRHLSLVGGIRAAMHRAPDKIAYGQGERTRTYRELLERVDRVTAALSAGSASKPGEHGAIIGKNSIEYMEIVLGASQAGVALAARRGRSRSPGPHAAGAAPSRLPEQSPVLAAVPCPCPKTRNGPSPESSQPHELPKAEVLSRCTAAASPCTPAPPGR